MTSIPRSGAACRSWIRLPSLRWAGFVETHLLWWKQEVNPSVARLELLASKKPGLLAGFSGAQGSRGSAE